MSDYTPSYRQQVIFDEWDNGDSNILISACAGSGKSTTILMLLERCQHRTLFLAFNKAIQEELQEKIDSKGLEQGKAMTIHSVGLSAIKNAYKRYKVASGKNYDLMKELQKANYPIFKKYLWREKMRINYCLIDMNDISRLYLTDDIQEIKKHFNTMDKTFFDFPDLKVLWEKLVAIRNKSYEADFITVDFVDMIYLPVLKNLEIPIYPYYLFVDECQDFSLCQHKIVDKMISQTVKRFVAVGDERQAIYGFSGASTTSFKLFLDKGNVKELPLDICYRCPTTVIDSANQVYPVMEYSSEREGVVGKVNNAAVIKDNSMVICRNSGPLIGLYFELLSLDKSVYIKGEDILNSIIRFLSPFKSYSIINSKIEMSARLDKLEEGRSEKEKIEAYIFKEDYNNFIKMSSYMCKEHDTVDTLLHKIRSIFVDKDNAICLCTIHKAKGLEADVVYILNEHLIPSKFAKSDEQLKQEENLRYVARSRAKDEMYFLTLL